MPKHATNNVTPARLVLGAAAAVLVVLVVWVAVRAGGPAKAGDEPTIVLPSLTAAAESSEIPPTLEATSAAPSPSASPSPSPSRPRSAAPSPSKKSPSASPSQSAKPSPSRPSPSPALGLSASYSTGGSWREGFIGGVRIVNRGGSAQSFTVTLSYPADAGVQVGGAWNASASTEGNRVILRGGPVPAGGELMIGFQGSKQEDDRVSPITCTINGASCRVS